MAQQSTSFEIQGHRGSRGLRPENTLPAFLKAIDEGVHTLEMDVVISKDKKVVVSHEPYFNPVISTDPSGKKVTGETSVNLYHLTYAEIKKYDVGKKGNPAFPEQQKMEAHKPLLREVLRETDKYARSKNISGLKYNIEIKSEVKEYGISQPDIEVFSDLVSEVLVDEVSPARVTIQSFDFNVLKHWHARMEAGKYPEVALSVLIEPEENNDITYNLDRLGFKPEIWSPNFMQVTPERLEQLHKMHIRVIPWTVNKPDDLKKIKAMGCDGLITDYPNRAKDL